MSIEITPSASSGPDDGAATPTAIASRIRPLPAMAGGLVSVGVGIGLAELIAALASFIGITSTATSGSPLSALGATFIQFTPEWLKELAISAFGTYDKVALRAGMGLTLAILAALLGLLAARRLTAATIAFAVLGVVVVVAVVTRPQAGLLDALPTVLGVIGGIVLLQLLFRPADPAPETADERAEGRRRFIRYAAGGAGLAVVSGGLSRLLPTSAAAEESVSAASQAAATASVQKMPPLPAGAQLDLPGITPFITRQPGLLPHRHGVHRAEAGRHQLAASHPRHGRQGDHHRLRRADRPPLLEHMVTLTCVSNEVGGDLVGNAVWQGPRQGPAREAGRQADADMVMSRSSDGFTASTPLSVLLDENRDAIFAVTMNGTAAVRARLPGADGRPRAVRIRLRHQMGGRARGLRFAADVLLDGSWLVADGDPSRSPAGSTFLSLSPSSGWKQLPWAGWPGRRHTGLSAASRSRSTTRHGRQRRWPRRSPRTAGGNGRTCGTPHLASTP